MDALYVQVLDDAKTLARAVGFVAALVFAAAGRVAALDLPDGLADGGVGVVDEVVDGDTVILEDGRAVRLVGIQAPKIPLGGAGFLEWPLAREAKAALERLVLGRRVRLAYGGQRTDRYRRQLAHLYREDDGMWIQGAMLAAGMARVYTFVDNRALIPSMLAAERVARMAATGIWAEPYYAVLDHRHAATAVGRFAIVEGRVVDAAIVRGRAYLNFGRNFRRDFTVTMAPETVALFEDEGLSVNDYRNRRIHVRGWVRSRKRAGRGCHPPRTDRIAGTVTDPTPQ